MGAFFAFSLRLLSILGGSFLSGSVLTAAGAITIITIEIVKIIIVKTKFFLSLSITTKL